MTATLGGSGEKSPSKDIRKNIPTIKFVTISFVHENPTHWDLKTAVGSIFVKSVLDIFAVCSLVPWIN